MKAGRRAVDTAVASRSRARNASYKPDWSYGLYLDNVGHLAAATQLWHKNAAAALSQTKGAGLGCDAFLLSQGSDRPRADRRLPQWRLGMAHESNAGAAVAWSRPSTAGMASALCAAIRPAAQAAIATFQKSYPQSFNVNAFYMADIKAAIALRANDPAVNGA